jgi:hypothetical protein
MKRFRSITRPQKRKKIIEDSPKRNSGDKKLEDFWVKPKKPIQEGFKFERENPIDNTIIPLVKNPSKQALISNQTNTNTTVNYKHKILFNETFIDELHKILEPTILKEIKNSIFNHPLGDYFDRETFDNFMGDNLANTLVKFILHTNDDFLFIPKGFMTRNSHVEKDKLKLFDGIHDMKGITYLQYLPINAKEVVLS